MLATRYKSATAAYGFAAIKTPNLQFKAEYVFAQ